MTTPETAGPSRMLLPVLAVMAASLGFQVGAAFAKTLFPLVGAQGVAALRLLFAALILAAYVQPWRHWPAKARLGPLVALGLCMAGVILMFYLALERLPLGVAIALQFLGPLAVALANSRQASDLAWAALAAAGVWGLVGHDAGSGGFDLIGVAWGLGAAACWAGYIVFGRSASIAFGRAAPALSIALAAIIVLPVGVQHAGVGLLSPAVIPIAILVALFSTAIPMSLELYAMPRMPPRTFGVFMSLEPAFGALSGLVILGEKLTLPQTAGVAAVVIAAAGATWSGAREAPPVPTDP